MSGRRFDGSETTAPLYPVPPRAPSAEDPARCDRCIAPNRARTAPRDSAVPSSQYHETQGASPPGRIVRNRGSERAVRIVDAPRRAPRRAQPRFGSSSRPRPRIVNPGSDRPSGPRADRQPRFGSSASASRVRVPDRQPRFGSSNPGSDRRSNPGSDRPDRRRVRIVRVRVRGSSTPVRIVRIVRPRPRPRARFGSDRPRSADRPSPPSRAKRRPTLRTPAQHVEARPGPLPDAFSFAGSRGGPPEARFAAARARAELRGSNPPGTSAPPPPRRTTTTSGTVAPRVARRFRLAARPCGAPKTDFAPSKSAFAASRARWALLAARAEGFRGNWVKDV
jgi:hypothetical protein